jgi:hypothetical protein
VVKRLQIAHNPTKPQMQTIHGTGHFEMFSRAASLLRFHRDENFAAGMFDPELYRSER